MNLINVPEVFKTVGGFLLSFWWFWLPLFLFGLFFGSWMYFIQRKWWSDVGRVILEIKPPKEIEQSPRIAEAVFAGLWSIFGTVSTKAEKYLKGAMQHYISFEIVGLNGQIKFLVNTPVIFRNFVEAKIYAEYPKAEIYQVEDYVNDLPAGILDKDWDLWGTSYQLAKPNPYPIRTYHDFVDILPKQPFIDPISNLMEVLAKLQPGEQAWIQILIRPTADTWIEEGKKLVGELIGKAAPKKEGVIKKEISTWSEAWGAFSKEVSSGKAVEIMAKKEEQSLPSKMQFLSPGEKDIVAGIENKMAKKGFETKIQLVYLGRKDVFFKPTVSSLNGFINQFATLNLNSLRPNPKYTTKAFYALTGERLALKKRVILKMCRQRSFWEKGFILNIEELASLWHFPTISVEAPMVPSVEAKKGGPPSELPVV